MSIQIPGLGLILDLPYQLAIADKMLPVPQLTPPSTIYNGSYNKPKTGNQVAAAGIGAATDYLSNLASNLIFDDSELGRGLGTLFSSGVSSVGNTLADNLIKGEFLTKGLGLNIGTSLAGAGAGIAANYIGQGLTSAIGNNYTGRAIGAGVSTGLGTIGGAAAGALATGAKIGTALSSINPYALAGNIIGSALSAGNGPSKEYGGKYGNITQGMDLAYDIAMVGANAIPVAGQFISAGMALNKGLSNLFGSTDGMTSTDAILGSAFMPAPIKWVNMWGSSKTGSFNNQSWLNLEKANSFMGSAFGDLESRFNRARREANKTYGTFSQGAKRRALRNLDYANNAWSDIMAMADLNEWQNIRSRDMDSINTLRYAQLINGGWNQLAIGKQGMKIFNNATNHNIGMRLLSAAALIDNKQMILSAQGGTKVLYDPDWSDKLEPYVAGIGLAGDAVGIGTAATGVGIPIGTAIAGFANIPNLIIDGYQTVRDAVRSYNDNGQSLGSAAWNSGELLLDATGLKILSSINRAKKAGVASKKYLTSTEKALDSKPWKRVGTGASKVRARRSANYKREYNSRRNKALEESNIELAKRGVRPALGLYYQRKLTDEMAKRGYGVAVNDAIKSANRTLRQNLAGISIINGGLNLYHLTK